MKASEIEDRAWADFSTIPEGLAQLKQMAADAEPGSPEWLEITDVARTLRRLQPAADGSPQ